MMHTSKGNHGEQDGLPAERDGESLQQRLNCIAGLDIERGLLLVRGRTDKYARILQLFTRSHGNDVAKLSAYREQGDIDAIRLLAHSLKGAGGTLGAMGVFEAALRLQEAIDHNRAEEEIDALCVAMIAELCPVMEGLRRVFPDAPINGAAT